jgi:nucleoside-diphosphate-sugar epimerase
MKTVLIAGSAGFLGSHLVEYYLGQGWLVFGLDNLSTGNTNNHTEFLENPNFTFFTHDIIEPLPELVAGTKFDLILNFACPASPPKYQDLAMETLRVSSWGVENMINLALKDQARLVQSSTSEVYGNPLVSPQTEDYWGNTNSYGPRSMYDEGKRYSEALIWTAQHKLGLNAGIVRIFNTYGPKMAPDDGRVVSTLIVEALANNTLTLHGDGNQTRSFCYVSDLIAGIALLAKSSEQTPINLGNPTEFSVRELAEKVLDLTKSKSKVSYIDRPVDDPNQRKPDISKAKKLLGWKPSIELEAGLIKTIEYFKNS